MSLPTQTADRLKEYRQEENNIHIYNAPRMRTLPQAIVELKKIDENTAITLRALRRMVNSGELNVFMVGKKRLINFDKLLEKLSEPNYNECDDSCTSLL